ncbi:MAG: CD225/dispanin family protein [Rhodococcus sp.]|nr:CD225/dispanin family protein [Rhodococcus sp. (in: high G+C Gram-positive bacteria)]
MVSSTGVPLPPRNAGWAVATIIFFWPIAFAAWNHVHDVYPKWAAGDYQGAQYASDRAKSLGKIAMWIFIIGWGLLFVLWIFIIIAAVSAAGSASSSSW